MRSDHKALLQDTDARSANGLRSGSDSGQGASPPAKDQLALAREILELAKACGIEVDRHSDPAEILVALEEDTGIPIGALATLAEILECLYRIRKEPDNRIVTAGRGRNEAPNHSSQKEDGP